MSFNRMPNGLVALCLSLLVLLGLSTSGEADETLVVRIDSMSFPPILHASESGEFSGTMGETVKLLCETAGMVCEFEVVPLSRAYYNLRNGMSDALVTINVGQLNDCCVASDWASPWTAGFFSSDGKALIPQEPDGLIGKSLIVVHGMKSPYLFAENLDEMAENGQVAMSKATNILSSVRMFLSGRAPLLWGGEDFEWYIGQLDANAVYDFEAKIELPVVVWISNERPDIAEGFNSAFQELASSGQLNDRMLLQPSLMNKRYQEAPMPE